MFDSDASVARIGRASVHVYVYAVDYRALWRYCWVWGPRTRVGFYVNKRKRCQTLLQMWMLVVKVHRRGHPDAPNKIVNDHELIPNIHQLYYYYTEEIVRERKVQKGPEKAPTHSRKGRACLVASQVKSSQVKSILSKQQSRENRVACSTAALHSRFLFTLTNSLDRNQND